MSPIRKSNGQIIFNVDTYRPRHASNNILSGVDLSVGSLDVEFPNFGRHAEDCECAKWNDGYCLTHALAR